MTPPTRPSRRPPTPPPQNGLERGQPNEPGDVVHDPSLAHTILYAIAAIGVLFVLLNTLVFDYYALAWVQCAFVGVIIATAVALRQERYPNAARWTSVTALALMLLYLYWYVQARHGSFVWLAMFPTVAFALLGTRRGVYAYGGFVLALAGLTGLYIREWPILTDPATLSNMGGAMLVFGGLSYYYERRRERSHREVSALANTDALTGFANRRQFVARGDALHELAVRDRAGYCLILMDIDHFKAINDHHGHPTGDEVIRKTLARVQSATRGDDLLARVGGEEFGVLMSDCEPGVALQRAEQIRHAVGDTPLSLGSRRFTVTLSIGVACVRDGDADFAAVYARADDGLYRAKHQGRDCVVGA